MLITAVLMGSLLPAVVAPVANAETGPSVPLPGTVSTPVVAENMGTRDQDQASSAALRGEQGSKLVIEGGGTTAATPLSPSATWAVSTHTGDFTWSYPLRVPPAPGGFEPGLALSYRSSAVDGRTSVTNNQPSWIGEGWDLSPGFVERVYGGCADDTDGDVKPPVTKGDLCWRSDNAIASYGGSGGMLIKDGDTENWRAKRDDGSRIERLPGADNGDDNGERWKITTADGVQYFFGSEAQSTWTVPVFGDDAGEPCHADTFDASHCVQAWRWNVDKVIDRNGNEIRYFYEKETNSYGMNGNNTAVPYVRGGTLSRVEYGIRAGSAPTGQVIFTLGDRCVRDSICQSDKPNNWPDVAWENKCDATPCSQRGPSFWSTKRLASITTKVWRGSAFADVDRWELDQEHPSPGDAEKAALWLKGIKHVGLVGGTAEMPRVTFEGTALPNRVDTADDGVSPLYRYRITGIRTEMGGVVSINYDSECRAGGPMPANPETNTLRCFPVRWAKQNHAERTDYFHKYVVTKVIQSDRLRIQGEQTISSPEQVVSYEYLDGAAWHWDRSEFVKPDKKTWNEFRGYGRVRTRTGVPDDPSGPVTMSEQRFYRGMDGDKTPAGTRTAKVIDSEGGERADLDWLQGRQFEKSSFEREGPSDQPDPPRTGKSISEPVWQGPTATRGEYKAYIIGTGAEKGYTALAAGGWRVTKSETTYDDRGLPTEVNDLGDLADRTDDRCSRTTYTRDVAKWILNLATHTETVSVHCGQDAVFPDDALSDTRSTYDGNGNLVKVEVATERPAAGAQYVTTATTAYDVHGRQISTTDALGRTSKTAYTPETGGPVTQTVTTTPGTTAVPAGLATTSTLEPAWGVITLVSDPNLRKTEHTYDPLGRRTAVWMPNRLKQDNPNSPSYRYSYLIRDNDASVVTTTKRGPNNTEISSNTLYDGMLRARQIQSPADGGGRLITDTRYDSQGRQWKSTQPYFNDSPVDTVLWAASDAEIPGHLRTSYDGAGRQKEKVYYAGAHAKWSTKTSYGGDWVHTIPPAGGTPVTKVTNARGQTTELRQHVSAGSVDSLRYTYTKAGQVETVTDPAGAVWRFGYDLLGRTVTNSDPDSGTSTMTYDLAGQLSTMRDARGQELAYQYDNLGRRTAIHSGTLTGSKIAEWTYDTVFKGVGQLASSSSWYGDQKYTRSVLSYNQEYRPTGTSVTIPAGEGLLAGTYQNFANYNVDGSITSQSLAAAGELPAEAVSYRYNNLGMLLGSSGGYEGKTFEYVRATEYTRYGELARVQLGTGTKRAWMSYYYDTNTRRLKRSIVDAEVANPMQSDTNYVQDPAGNITSIADRLAGDIQCFKYDSQRRLTDAWTPGADTWSADEGCRDAPAVDGLRGPASYWLSFTHDKTGNRQTETRHAATGNTTRTFGYQVPGHPHAISSAATAGPGVASQNAYEYNAAGQLTKRVVAGVQQDLTWDEQGKLAKVTQPGKETSHVYDADGNRLIRRDPTSTTLYLGDQEVKVNRSGGNPTVTRYYTYDGRPIAVRQGRGALTWLAGDHQGTAAIAINSETLGVTKRWQLPYGGARGTSAAWPGERGFVGGTTDASTGFTHFGAREYDPDIGRFISVDPVLNSADSQQMNGYTYSNSNPITFSDPSGAYCDSCDFYNQPQNAANPGDWGNTAPSNPIGPLLPSGSDPWKPKTEYKRPNVDKLASRVDKQVWRAEGDEFIPSDCRTGPALTTNLGCALTNSIRQDMIAERARQQEAKNRPKGPSMGQVAKNVGSTVWEGAKFVSCTNPVMWAQCFIPPGVVSSQCASFNATAYVGVEAEACLARDHQGYGYSLTGKTGVQKENGMHAGLSQKWSQGSIDDLGGTGEYFGVSGGVLEAEVGRGHDGKWSGEIGMGRRVGVPLPDNPGFPTSGGVDVTPEDDKNDKIPGHSGRLPWLDFAACNYCNGFMNNLFGK